HLSELHSSAFLLGSDLQFINKLNFFSKLFCHKWIACWAVCPPPDEHVAEIKLTSFINLFGFNVLTFNFKVLQIGPAIVHLQFTSSIGVNGILVQVVTPLETRKHRIVHSIYVD